MGKKIVISAGGTGGHIYPAQSLAYQLLKETSTIEILFVGGGLNTNTHFKQTPYPFQDISCGTFIGRNPFTYLRSLGRIIKGSTQSSRILKDFQPHLVIGFGSYHSFPLLLSAKLAGIPIVLHEANTIPGKVNRLFSSSATFTGIHFPQTASLLKGKTLLAKMPLRKEYADICKTKDAQALARKHFHLHPSLTTLLVFGGSQGAQGINQLVVEALTQTSNKIHIPFQILHFTGNSIATQNIKQAYDKKGIPSCVKDFESQMHMAWLAADLVIGRSGASTIAEQMVFEVPGILIPYPSAADNHQEENARHMSDKVKGALFFNEKALTSLKLVHIIHELLQNDNLELTKMQQAIQLHKNQSNLKEFSTLVLEVL